MKRIFPSLLLPFLLSLQSASAAESEPAQPKLVVAILVDQLRYEYLERFHEHFGQGGFRLLMEKGAFMTRAHYDYFPTVTAPGHASYLSGAAPSMHGIIANDWFDPATNGSRYCVSDPSVEGVGASGSAGKMSPRNFIGSNFADEMRLRFGSRVVGISMKDRGAILPAGKKPVGAYWFESKSGNFITSTYYTSALPDWAAKFNEQRLGATYTGQKWDRLIDAKYYLTPDDAAGEKALEGETTVTFPHTIAESKGDGLETIMPTPFGNQLLLEFAKAVIDGEKLGQGSTTDLFCISFSSIDYCGHRFGPYSHEVQDMVLRLDLQLKELFEFLEGKIGLANVTMVLTADHGVAPTPDYAKSQGFEAEALDVTELMRDLQAKISERFGSGKYFLSGGLTPRMYEGNLYFDPKTLEEKNVTVEELSAFIRTWALGTGKFQAVFSREQLLDGRTPGLIGQLVLNGYNAERSGDVVLVPKPYMIHWSGGGTTHGSPYAYDTHVPVLFYGQAFKPGRYNEEFYITDIVPTLSSALRMNEPPVATGKPVVGALKP